MAPSHPIFQDLFFLLVPLLVLAVIPLMGKSTARMTGWARLAAEYPALKESGGFQLRGRRCRFGKWMSYKGIVTLGADGEGLYLSLTWFFKSGHPPILIPWKEMRSREERAFLRDWVLLEMARTPGITLALGKNDVLKLNEMGGRIPMG